MRTRQRLIEVLDSVNPQVVNQIARGCCYLMADLLKEKWAHDIRADRVKTIESRLKFAPEELSSPHIRELLTEGLAILEADKLTGCKAS